MDEDRFWALVDDSRRRSEGDLTEQTRLLHGSLALLDMRAVVEFDLAFQQASAGIYTWAHWRAAELMIGWSSEDVFTDFRSWVVSRGREVYERVRDEPDELAEVPLDDSEEVGEAELFSAVAGEVYEQLTGRELGRPTDGGSADVPLDEPAGESLPEDEETMRRLFPRLVERAVDHPPPDPRPATASRRWWRRSR